MNILDIYFLRLERDIRDFVYICFQKARLARIHMAKNASGAAFLQAKKKVEERIMARQQGHATDDGFDEKDDTFDLQHHHLLTCLEKTTVSNNKKLVENTDVQNGS